LKLTTYEDWSHLLKLAEAGDNIAQGEVALHYDSGLIVKGIEIVKEDQSMAFKWYYSAYENGNINAITRVADFLIEGLYCKQDIELAIELYQKGIDNGYGIAANNLAVFYRDKQDYKRRLNFINLHNTLIVQIHYHWHFATILVSERKKM
jgi:TPR repeat protein